MKKASLKLTARDVVLLIDIYKHRYLTIGQIERLHFPSLQTAYRRSKVLKDSGYLIGFNVANIGEGIFSLTSKGLDTVAGSLGVERNDLKWNEGMAKPKDHYFMRHFIAINDFRISLRIACKETQIRLLGFIPDYYGERTDKSGVAKYIKDVICDSAPEQERISHTPDGVFALEKDAKAALFFLEIDRGTEVVTDKKKGILKSLMFYTNYLIEAKYNRYAKDFSVEGFKGFRTLYVVQSQSRLQNIRNGSVGIDVPQKAKRFIWLSTWQELNTSGVFSSVWHSLDPGDRGKYSILGGKHDETTHNTQ